MAHFRDLIRSIKDVNLYQMETKMGKAETDKAETDKAEMVLFVVRIKNKSQECVSV